MKKMAVAVLFCLGFWSAISSGQAIAAGPTDQQLLVDQSLMTLRAFQAAPDMHLFRGAVKTAKGIFIVPDLYKGGLGLGGSFGKGVYMAKDTTTGKWRGPAFYDIGSLTLGIQAGGEVSQVIILAMTDDAVNKMLSSHFELGSDASAAAWTTGVGTSGNSAVPLAAFISFSRSKGIYGGLNLEGSFIKPDDEANAVYYGANATPGVILSRRGAKTPEDTRLRKEMARLETASGRAID